MGQLISDENDGVHKLFLSDKLILNDLLQCISDIWSSARMFSSVPNWGPIILKVFSSYDK